MNKSFSFLIALMLATFSFQASAATPSASYAADIMSKPVLFGSHEASAEDEEEMKKKKKKKEDEEPDCE